MKKSVLLLCLMFVFPVRVRAWEACGTDGQGNTANCEYEIKNGTLTIRGTGDEGNIGYWWSSAEGNYKAPWGKQQFKNVVIEDSIKDLGSYGFVGVSSVNPIQIPTSIDKITYASFQQVTTPEVIIPSTVTHIEGVAFFDANIQRLNIPDSVTSMDRAFRASPFTDIVIPDSVEIIPDKAFSQIKNLQSITVGENTILGSIFQKSGNDEFTTDISQLKIYCTGDTSKCDEHLANAGYPELKSIAARTEKINGRTYVYDLNGHRVAVSGQKIIKRIYTVEEAEKISKKNGNTFKLRYK
ncbi:MAG: leucine-rich repeat domain-containing protein [Alphaproteobacteria bacterium]|nr:leucine-rich repeat domain-containing protein [Alphaproteobacteria bacterium]